MLRATLLLGLLACLPLACGAPESVAPPSSPAPTAAPRPTSPSTSTITSSGTTAETSTIHSTLPPPFYGAGSPPLEERIYESDAIVRATLISTGNSPLRFKVLEYLKGSGPSEITVDDHPALRNTSHDKREAVLFLSRTTSSSASGESGASNGAFTFTAAHYDAPGYTIDTLDPAWLPAKTDTSGASGETSSTAFITDSGVAPGMSQETVSLTDLRTKIAWVGGGKNVADYDHCILSVIDYLSWDRDYEAYYGKSWSIPEHDESLASGAGTGAVVSEYGQKYHSGYSRFWLTGTDAALFSAPIVDSNTTASDGYSHRIETARPLPGGTYKFRFHGTLYDYIPCNFAPTEGTGGSNWTVTVTAPTGTVHEAFFDPVSITTIGIGGGGTTIGADIHSGVLKPRAFTGAGGVSASLRSLGWQSGKVKLVVAPHNALTGYMLDFIGTDGKVTRSLNVANATVHAASNSLSWSVATAPWKAGDKLMVRVRPAPASPSPTATPTPKPKATPTPPPKGRR